MADKFAAMVVVTIMVTFTIWASLYMGAILVDMDIGAWPLAQVTTSAAWLGLVFGAFALALGCATGKRNMSIGVTVGLAASAYLYNALAPLADALEPTRVLSPFYYYNSADPLSNGLDPVHMSVMTAAIAVLLAAAMFTFERRDVGV